MSFQRKEMKQSVTIDGTDIAVWTDPQVMHLSQSPSMFMINWNDMDEFNPRIASRMLELENDQKFTHLMPNAGPKIRDIHKWGIPEAELIHERAMELFSQATGNPRPTVDVAWGNINRHNQYLNPHSHTNCIGSVVYCVDTGDQDPDNELSGRFVIVDPRVEECCPLEPGRVTLELTPDMKPGTMIVFPSDIVHFVHPYTGHKPRMTIAWNLK
ncbi:MAG: 2OG-Fe(II) oxygenase family protein [Gammaproteobacteria bacterium]|nr:2OG-Fe(II) oxygenase family protein [Gammaproteobacteria bacterium]